MHNGFTYRRMFALMAWRQKMSLTGLALFLITVASLGSLSKSFSERKRGSWLSGLTVSLLGAWLGFWLAQKFQAVDLISGVHQANTSPILWAAIGSGMLFLLSALLSRIRQFLRKRFQPSALAAPVRKNLSSSKP